MAGSEQLNADFLPSSLVTRQSSGPIYVMKSPSITDGNCDMPLLSNNEKVKPLVKIA